MKNNLKSAIMVFAAIATVAFAGCKNVDGPEPGEERNATLNIKLVNPTHTRVVGAASSSENTIKDVNIFVLDGGNSVYRKAWISNVGNLASYVATIEVTTAAKAVYAIANAGINLTETYNNKGDLEAALATDNLPGQYTALWATGYQDGSSWTFQSADSNGNGKLEQNVNLTLNFIAARIAVTVVNDMHDYDGTTDGTVKISNVAVLNARGQSKLFGTSLIPGYDAGKKFYEGLANPATPFANYPGTGEFTMDTENLNDDYSFSATAKTSNYYFYVFESDSDELGEYPTIVTLVGTDVSGNATYFPVHLAPYETWANNTEGYTGGVERGKSYNITITLKGEAKEGSGGGVADPTLNVKDVELMVTLSIANWTAVPLGKNF